MEGKSERQRMEDWVRDVEARRKPRPRDHNMSREDIEERNETSFFQTNLALGKLSERYVAEKLMNIKFIVQDISEEKFEGRGDGLYLSPFDLLVSAQQFFLFVADVKRRNYKVPIGIPVLKLADYESYNKYDANDKLIIFHFPIRRGHEDCLFITVKDIKDMCYIVGPFYHIEMCQLTALTTKALINTLEDRSKQ